MVIVVVIDVNFDVEVCQFDIFVVVDFWVEWCGLCKMIGLVLEELLDEMVGKVKIVKVNVDENLNLFV